MRVLHANVKDARSVRQYAYSEDRNAHHRESMEDNCLIHDDPNLKGTAYFGVFDGHGGSFVSQYVVANYVQIMEQVQTQYPNETIKKQLELSCAFIDDILTKMDAENEDKIAQQTGTTLCLAYIQGSEGHKVCHVANLGDTRAVLCQDGTKPRRVTVDHKVTNPSERDRIRNEGGTIFGERVAGQLAITRAVGDLFLKGSGVSVCPDVTSFPIDQHATYLILASDGLWDVLEDHEAVEMTRGLVGAGAKSKALLRWAMDNGTVDNVSVMVLQF